MLKVRWYQGARLGPEAHAEHGDPQQSEEPKEGHQDGQDVDPVLAQIPPAVRRQVGHHAELEGEDRPDHPVDPSSTSSTSGSDLDDLGDGDGEQEHDREQDHRQTRGPLDAVGSGVARRVVVGCQALEVAIQLPAGDRAVVDRLLAANGVQVVLHHHVAERGAGGLALLQAGGRLAQAAGDARQILGLVGIADERRGGSSPCSMPWRPAAMVAANVRYGLTSARDAVLQAQAAGRVAD